MPIRLRELQDRLRAHIRARINRHEFTGLSLSRQAGFPQGHLSNFLNARRGLSLESMDRLLETLRLEVLDLVESDEIRQRALLPAGDEGLEPIAIVSAEHAVRIARFTPEQVTGSVSFHRVFLRRLKSNDICDRGDWLRFVCIRLDPGTAQTVLRRSERGATLLIDRHYTSLEPYRGQRPNLYAAHLQARCLVGYLSLAGDHVVVRPRNSELPLETAKMSRARGYADYMLGRVCHVAMEV